MHDGGTTEVTRNQRVGGGFWQYLGSYSFDPLLNPAVTLAANDNGSVAADAVRFVGGPAGSADIAYLHTDHLGTPQAMTDAGAQLLWWRDQMPFGQTVATGGFSETPLRFPGQFADAESGLHYNYFRDYDPALGRYIQSDPIGLRGGLNTYGYVKGNPLNLYDPNGLGPIKVAVICIRGIKKIRNISFKGAVREAQKGNVDIYANNAAEAAKISRAASNGRKPIKDKPHGSRDSGYRPHYHTNPRTRTHIFYSIAAALTFADACGEDCFLSPIAPVIDFFSPLSTPQDLIDLYEEF